MEQIKLIVDNGTTVLKRGNEVMLCPFRQPLPVPKQQLIGGGMQMEYINQHCGTWCPHFDIHRADHENSKTIVTLCHGTKHKVQDHLGK